MTFLHFPFQHGTRSGFRRKACPANDHGSHEDHTGGGTRRPERRAYSAGKEVTHKPEAPAKDSLIKSLLCRMGASAMHLRGLAHMRRLPEAAKFNQPDRLLLSMGESRK